MKGVSVVWPTVFKIMTDNGWIDPSRLTIDIVGIGPLPGYLSVPPASKDIDA